MTRVASLCFLGAVVLLGILLSSGCSEKSTWPSPPVVLESVPTTQPPRIDGVALDREWYSAPELLIALSDSDGNQGGNFYLRMRSVYTVYPDTVYFVLQWADTTDDALPDRLVYAGPEWLGIDCSKTDLLLQPSTWTTFGSEVDREDRFCILFEITPVSDETGSFASRGCHVSCHNGMRTVNGSFDAWYWLRARTDPVLRCDDMVLDSDGFRGDQGEGTWRSNLRGIGNVPRFIARGSNGGLSPSKFVYDPGIYGRPFAACDTMNPATLLSWGDSRDPAVDYVPGYLVKEPTGSRGDIVLRSKWDDGRWTVEMKRTMSWPPSEAQAHAAEDVTFSRDRTYNFAVAVMNGSRIVHSGSAPFVLKFRR